MAKIAGALEIVGGAALVAFVPGAQALGVGLIMSGISTEVSAFMQPKAGNVDNARAVDPRVQGSRYGAFIPRVYGTPPELAGQVIWATSVKDTPTVTPGTHSKQGSTPSTTNHSYSRSFGVQFCTKVAGVTRIKADDKVIYESSTLGEINTGKIHIMVGTEDQMPDSWYEADKGVGRVSAHRGYLTVWFHDFVMDSYGDRIPNIRVEAVQAVDPDVNDIITSECALVGIPSTDLNLTETSGLAFSTTTVSGFLINSQLSPRATLEQLGRAMLFDGAEYDAKLNFHLRPQTDVIEVPAEDIGWIEEADDVDAEDSEVATTATRKNGLEIAKHVDIVYFDKTRDYEEGTQSYSRQNFNSAATLSISFAMVMSPAYANKLAKIVAVTGWNERTPRKFSLPAWYFIYTSGTVFNLTSQSGRMDETRAEKFAFSASGVVRVEGISQLAEAYDQTGDGATGEAPPLAGDALVPSGTDLWLGDYPALLDKWKGKSGYFHAGAPSLVDGGNMWSGYGLYRDRDGAGDWQGLATQTAQATMGALTSSLPSASGIDATNTFTLTLTSGEIASITATTFSNTQEANLAVIEQGATKEVIQFRDVTDLGGGDYEIAYISRGLRGTSGESFTAGAKFVLINEAVGFVEVNEDEVGTAFNHRAVTAGQTIDDPADNPFTWTGEIIDPDQSVEGEFTSQGNINAQADLLLDGVIVGGGAEFSKTYFTTRRTITSTTTTTLDLATGNSFEVSLSTNTTIAFSNMKAGATYTFKIKQDATGGRSLAWPASAKWIGGAAPAWTTAANAVDLVELYCDGTNLYQTRPAALDVK